MDSIFPFDAVGDYGDLGLNLSGLDTEIKLWNALSYDLARRGLSPFGRGVVSTRLDNGNVSVITDNNQKTQIQTSKLYMHSLENIYGLDIQSPPVESYRVFDWFDVRAGMNHRHAFHERTSNFCKKFYFYLSGRIDGAREYKDLVVESELDTGCLNDPDYSDTTTRLVATRIMKELGIHKSPRLETKKRQVIPIRKKIYYEFSFDGNNSR